MDAALFDYDLPEASIAQEAIEPRDTSRLLVASTLTDLTFTDLPDLLDPGDLIVVNNTRVRPARLHAVKDTGGAVEVLLTSHVEDTRWEALVRPARRIRPGTRMTAGPLHIEVLTAPVRGVVTVAVDAPGDLDDALTSIGEVPLPPYFHGTLEDDERYQTMFASEVGSAAAPTAALHFTPGLVDRLGARRVQITEVELEVGLDTFRPMQSGPIADHEMHRERYTVPSDAARAIETTKRNGGRVVAVGTTVVRTLESAAADDGTVRPSSGATELFITPGYEPRVIDALITNFHAPRTTLIVMIAALLGERWRDVYAHAITAGYRFLSFGDAMFIEVRR